LVQRTYALPDVMNSLAEGLRAGGMRDEAANLDQLIRRLRMSNDRIGALNSAKDALTEFHARDKEGGMTPLLRTIPPFALDGEASPARPFFVIEDATLNPSTWRGGPMTIYIPDFLPEIADALPQSAIFDSEQGPYVWWNSAEDLTSSKLLHTSVQAFYLRRYAGRVAALWEKEYGHRPVINAITSMSLNGRPHQALVDPNADLASVHVVWFGHNPWIRDVETKRIPRDALDKPPML
jgi:hypothetical protein